MCVYLGIQRLIQFGESLKMRKLLTMNKILFLMRINLLRFFIYHRVFMVLIYSMNDSGDIFNVTLL